MLLKIICHYFLEKEGTDRKNKVTQNRKTHFVFYFTQFVVGGELIDNHQLER